MNDDPIGLLNAVFLDARGRNPAVVQRIHPQYDPARVAIRMIMPGVNTNLPTDGRVVVAWNHEFQTPAIDELPFHYLVRGSKPLNSHMPLNHEYFSWHLSETARANAKQPIQVPTAAPFLADALLGINKPERIQLLGMMRDAGLVDRCLLSMFKTLQFHKATETYVSPQLAHYDDARVAAVKKDPTSWSSMASVESDTGTLVPASQIIPRKIYAASYISVIAETHPQIDQFFVTEKTGKALAAGRIFLLQGGPGYLRHLRELGFKTFAPFVNETYDEIQDMTARNTAIVDELARLSTINLKDLYHKLLPVLEHNQQLMYSGELNKPAQQFLRNIQRWHG